MEWFLYNRMWAVGVFGLIEGIGLEPTEDVRLLFYSCKRLFLVVFGYVGRCARGDGVC